MNSKTLLAIVTIALVTGAPAVFSSEPETAVHPVIGNGAPKDIASRDIMALPEKERLAWIHGAVSASIQVIGLNEMSKSKAQCGLDWYFGGGQGKQVVPLALNKYPDTAAVTVVAALINNECKDV